MSHVLPGKPEALVLQLEAGAKNLRVHRVFELVKSHKMQGCAAWTGPKIL